MRSQMAWDILAVANILGIGGALLLYLCAWLPGIALLVCSGISFVVSLLICRAARRAAHVEILICRRRAVLPHEDTGLSAPRTSEAPSHAAISRDIGGAPDIIQDPVACAVCGAPDLDVFYLGQTWQTILCEACYATQHMKKEGA